MNQKGGESVMVSAGKKLCQRSRALISELLGLVLACLEAGDCK